MSRIIRTIGASIGVTVCFFYLGCGSLQAASASASANSAPLTIATKLLPAAIAGTPYVVVLDATGGTPAYTWGITSGVLPSGISLTPTTGVISGTPMVSGNFSVGLALADSSSPTQKRTSTVTIKVAPASLQIVASVLPSATSGTAYSQTLHATGGTPSYAWSVTSGALPAGLSLGSSTGVISGTPKANGTSNFAVTVRDNERPAQSRSLAMNICVGPSPLKITTLALPSAVGGAGYSQILQASGGTPGYRWTIASGNLPAGLSLTQSTGAITGVPVTSGTSAFIVSASDSSSPVQTTSAPMTIVVSATRLTIVASTLPSVTVGTAYSQGLQASGGTAPYHWSVTSGQLPVGLALTPSTGAISGTPTTIGTTTFTVTVADSSSPSQSAAAATTVVVQPAPLTIQPSTLPAVRVGSAYSRTMQATGGTVPYVWSIASGNLPAGLALASSTGTISGIPTASGISTFTATVKDSGIPTQASSATATVVVAPTLLAITSSTFPSVNVGTIYQQSLQASGGSAPYSWSVASGNLPGGLFLTRLGAILGIPTASGTSTFTADVTDSSSPAQVTSATATIVVAPATAPIVTPPAALIIATTTLPPSTVGTAYAQTLQATGGTAPYVWSITSGQLPAGLSVSAATGTISGSPTSAGSSAFTVTVSDSGSPVQTQAATMTIVAAVATANPLTIVSSALSTATSGTAYLQVLRASGGTPAYTWSITSGTLPSGLTLAATTGTISGTPTSSGTSNLTVNVTDNSSPAQTQSASTSITVTAAIAAGPGATWFIRPDGGTRYSSNATTGQCDGKADVAYPGSGTNQHCAYNDFRYLWDDNSGSVGAGAWVIAGGDTVIVRGCAALPGQQNSSNPNCRIGWDKSTGSGPDSSWCYGVGSYDCHNPAIPAGTASQHTRILGQNYAACNAGGATNPKLYESNLTQIYGGFSLGYTLNLENTQYVDVQCLEITSHNGACTWSGSPSYPRTCNASQPLDDYAGSGILTNNATSNLTLQDVYIHGFNSSGLFGPIGGPITMTRMFVGFNEFAGWNFDDGGSTPDAPGSSITANYVLMEGNGCYEEYPIVDAFPARVCYDTNDQGFGDSWSGQNTVLDSMYCNHCDNLYNTKDGFIGPHTWISNLVVTNSTSIGNMGQNWKWGGNTTPNNTTFTNNLTVGNCLRMNQPMPGAPSNYNQYLTGFCRAAGNVVASVIPSGSTWLIANNTWVTYQPTVFDIACPYGLSPCPSTVNVTNNVFLGYVNPNSPYGASTPALYYIEDPTIAVHSTYNVEFGIRNGDCSTGGTGIVCTDPLLVGEPSQGTIPPESTLDNFNFHLASGSPAIGAGTIYPALPSTDYYGTATTNPPVIGAVEP